MSESPRILRFRVPADVAGVDLVVWRAQAPPGEYALLTAVAKPDIRTSVTRSEHLGRDQAWFWSDDWYQAELEADRDISSGRTVHFESAEALLGHLESLVAE